MSGLSPKLREFIQRWTITTVAVLIAEWMVSGIRTDTVKGLLIATLLLGTLNALLRPLLVAATVGALAGLNALLGLRIALLTLPLQVLFFGFLLLTISASMLLLVGRVVPSFHVDGFWAAFWGGVVISLATLLLNSFTGTGNARFSVHRGRRSPRPERDRDGDDPGGPIIDV